MVLTSGPWLLPSLIALLPASLFAFLIDPDTKVACAIPGAFYGIDNQQVQASSADHCRGMCVPGQCTGWTFKLPTPDENQGTCYLKDVIESYDGTKGQFISGFTQRNCDGECLSSGALYTNAEDRSIEGREPYKVSSLLPEINHIACQSLCYADTACILWNYDNSVHTCEFYSSATSLEYLSNSDPTARQRYKSGSKNCWEVCFMQGVAGGDDTLYQEFLQESLDATACQQTCQDDPEGACAWFTLKAIPPTDGVSTTPTYACRLYAQDAPSPTLEVIDTGLSITGPPFCGNGAKAFTRKSALHSLNILPAVVGPLTLDQLESEVQFSGDYKLELEVGEYYPYEDAPSPFDERTVEELEGLVDDEQNTEVDQVVDSQIEGAKGDKGGVDIVKLPATKPRDDTEIGIIKQDDTKGVSNPLDNILDDDTGRIEKQIEKGTVEVVLDASEGEIISNELFSQTQKVVEQVGQESQELGSAEDEEKDNNESNSARTATSFLVGIWIAIVCMLV